MTRSCWWGAASALLLALAAGTAGAGDKATCCDTPGPGCETPREVPPLFSFSVFGFTDPMKPGAKPACPGAAKCCGSPACTRPACAEAPATAPQTSCDQPPCCLWSVLGFTGSAKACDKPSACAPKCCDVACPA